jgi:hypothetical protein
MPKRKVKEEKPRKRLGKKELLIPPAAMGVSTYYFGYYSSSCTASLAA